MDGWTHTTFMCTPAVRAILFKLLTHALQAPMRVNGYVAVYNQGAPCRGFFRHIFSESHYPKLLIATCWHSDCGGFIDSRHVI